MKWLLNAVLLLLLSVFGSALAQSEGGEQSVQDAAIAADRGAADFGTNWVGIGK